MSPPPRKRRRTHTPTAAPPPEATPALPSDLVLEVVARSDAETLLRCAACCRHLRREILRPAFVRRVCRGPGAVARPRLLGLLQCRNRFAAICPAAASQDSPPPPPFALAHPATPAAADLAEKHLAPLVSRGGAADLLARYDTVTTRGGLVVLRRQSSADAPRESAICVYDPMSGECAFLPDPPEMAKKCPGRIAPSRTNTFVLLTASDGITGCSFLLVNADFKSLVSLSCSIKVQTVSRPDAAAAAVGDWSRVTSAACHGRSRCTSLRPYCSAVVLGGTIHWVMHGGKHHHFLHVLTYNVGTSTAGSIELPMDLLGYKVCTYGDINLRLSSTPDGRLTVLVSEELKISVWVLSAGAGAGWVLDAVIHAEATLRSMMPELPESLWHDNMIMFDSTRERSGVVLIYLAEEGDEEGLIALDVETKEMHRLRSQRNIRAFPFEINMEPWLLAMKTF